MDVQRKTANGATEAASEIASSSEALSADEGEGVLAALSATLCSPLTHGNSIEPLRNGDQIFPAMLAAIESAEQTINFLTYVYWQGEVAREFAASLCAAARRGVGVRVLIDAVGGARMEGRLVDLMREAGCKVAMFNPLHRGAIRKNNWRTHRKVMVVDGRLGFTGGVGIGEEWTGHAQDPDHWRDDHYSIEGPIVSFLQGAFADNWRCEKAETLVGEVFYPAQSEPGSVSAIPILGRPGADPSGLATSYQILLAEARRSIDLATPYFVPDAKALQALREASERGVRVRLLIPGEHCDSRLAQWASEGLLPQVMAAGVEVYRFLPTLTHTKAMIIDATWSVIGSANYDCRSFELNHELNLVVGDRHFATRMGRQFERDLARSRRVRESDLDARPLWRKLRSRAALLFRSQL